MVKVCKSVQPLRRKSGDPTFRCSSRGRPQNNCEKLYEPVQGQQRGRFEGRLKTPWHPEELGVEEDPDADHHQIERDDQ